MPDDIICQHDGELTRITLNRPDDGNRVSNDMGTRLVGLFQEAEARSKLILLRGAGPDFCLGRAPVPMNPGAPPPSALETRANNEPPLKLYAAFRDTRIPIVCAVQGRAESVGCSAAALCDVTIAADDSRFCLPEMKRRIPPTLAMSALVDRISRKAVSYMVLTSDELSAAEALNFGIVSRVVPAAGLDADVDRVVGILLDRPKPSLMAVKEFLRAAPDMNRQAATDFAANLISNVMSSYRD